MNKVLQAAGRVIRTEQDYGCILLLDDRFCRAVINPSSHVSGFRIIQSPLRL